MELKLSLKLRTKDSKQTNKAREENCTDEDLGICERDICNETDEPGRHHPLTQWWGLVFT